VPPAGVLIERLEGAPQLVPTHFHGPLSEALGGVVLGRNILVGGLQGSGKSTLCAELVAAMAGALREEAYWLDAEMSRGLVAGLFPRTRSPVCNVRRIPRKGDDALSKPISWRTALAAVPLSAAAIVFDSLQRWAPKKADQTELLEAIAGLKTTVFVISHSNKKGEIAGSNSNQHDTDATAIVSPAQILVSKSRWVPTPRVVSRPPLVHAG
jgi:predicted ATP-dependent serine protease